MHPVSGEIAINDMREQDEALVTSLENKLLKLTGGPERFEREFCKMLRNSIDSVIDANHTGRLRLSEIEKTEKTYLGTKIEIRLRHLLRATKGDILDLKIDGTEVDIKNTVASQWTIPPEAIGHPCILIRSNETKALCSVGLLVIREVFLNPGKNRDQKKTISKAGMSHVRWILQDTPYPQNFWEFIEPAIHKAITSPRGGTARLAELFRLVQKRPISRTIVESVAQQKDSLKRLRKNGGARDQLAREGIAIFWGKNDRDLIDRLGLPFCSTDEFVAYQPQLENEIQWVRDAGHL